MAATIALTFGIVPLQAVATPMQPEDGLVSDGKVCDEERGQPETIVSTCSRVIAAGAAEKPQMARFHASRGRAYEALGDSSASLDDYLTATEYDPSQWRHWNAAAWELGAAGEVDRALEAALSAIALAPDEENNYDLKGWLLRKLDRPEETLEALSLALAMDGDDDWTLRETAWSLRLLKRYELALERVEQALKLDPDDPYNHHLKGYRLCENPSWIPFCLFGW